MSNIKNNQNLPSKHLSEAELLRYKEGDITNAEMHRVERHLMECELCNDAYEGIISINTHDFKEDVNQLKATFQGKYTANKEANYNWKWIAAAIILFVIAVSAGLWLTNTTNQNEAIVQHAIDHEDKAVVQDETIVAENLEDTIINHHIGLNDQAQAEIHGAPIKPFPVTPPLISENSTVINDKIVNQSQEIIALTEKFPESKESDNIYFESIEAEDSNELVISRETKSALNLTKRQTNNHFEPGKKINIPVEPGLVTGKVIDEIGTPIPGVNIIVKGTSNGTLTDKEGNYELTKGSKDDILIFSTIGYMTEEIEITESSPRVITLQPDIMALNEVVVVGYGTQSSGAESVYAKKTYPRPAIGLPKYRQFIKDNQKFPEAAQLKKIEGNVTLQFQVDSYGTLSNISVINSPGKELDDEAIRMLKEGPAWNPATLDGVPVAETVQLKFPFKLRKE
ncbi:carboxypeptidase-like regulatory domain-containing protein [soil metagenome]